MGSEKTQDTIVRMVIRRSPLIQTKWSDRGTDNGNARTRISGEWQDPAYGQTGVVRTRTKGSGVPGRRYAGSEKTQGGVGVRMRIQRNSWVRTRRKSKESLHGQKGRGERKAKTRPKSREGGRDRERKADRQIGR